MRTTATTSRNRKTSLKSLTKRLEPYTAVFALALSVIALLGYFTGTADWLYHRLTDDLRIKVRKEEFHAANDYDRLSLVFSLANVSKDSLFLNSMTFRIGDYVGGGRPPYAYIVVAQFDRELVLQLVEDPSTGRAFPVLRDNSSTNSMGSKEFSLLATNRLALAPKEQIDYFLQVTLRRPTRLAGKYRKVWDLGGRLNIVFEDASLKEGHLAYPQ